MSVTDYLNDCYTDAQLDRWEWIAKSKGFIPECLCGSDSHVKRCAECRQSVKDLYHGVDPKTLHKREKEFLDGKY